MKIEKLILLPRLRSQAYFTSKNGCNDGRTCSKYIMKKWFKTGILKTTGFVYDKIFSN